MRTPGQYLPVAVRALRQRMPESTETMSCDGYVATVTRVGSFALNGRRRLVDDADSLTARVAADRAVIAATDDFPTIDVGSVATLDNVARMVVECSSDPAAATLKIKLSRELDAVSFVGAVASDGRGTARGRFRALAENTALDSDVSGAIPAFEGSARGLWTIYIPMSEWPVKNAPAVSRRLVVFRDDCGTSLTVQRVTPRRSLWELLCVERMCAPAWEGV